MSRRKINRLIQIEEKDSRRYEEVPNYLPLDIKDVDEIRKFSKKSFSVKKLCEMIDEDELILDPEWQRNHIWDKDRMALFLESIYLGFPIQPIYFHLDEDGYYVTVDGRQRLTTLYNFYNSDIDLGKFEFLTDLNDLELEEYPSSFTNKVLRFELDCVVFNKFTSTAAVYKFFERINTKGMQLSTMEIRNCIHNGRGMDFIRKLSIEEAYVSATTEGFKPTRLRDMESILRFISIYHFEELIDKHKNMTTLLDAGAFRLNNLDRKSMVRIKKTFLAALEVCEIVFESFAFRKKLASGNRSRANMGLFEAVLYFVHENPHRKIIANKEKIKRKYFKIIQDEEFVDSIGRRSYEMDMLKFRLSFVNRHLKACLK